MASSGLFESFIGALQASLSVLLVVCCGGVAAKLGILNSENTKPISKICVRLFLPALLITKIGEQVDADSAGRYLTILVWGLLCHAVSFAIGTAAQLGLGMPDWTTVAVMFNNSTSYPLLLIEALAETGILKSLIGSHDSSSDATDRAKSYFLIYATVSSCLTFAVGPRLIDSENAPDSDSDSNSDTENESTPDPEQGSQEPNEETGLLDQVAQGRVRNPFAEDAFFLGHRPALARKPSWERRRAGIVPRQKWIKLSPRARWWILFITDFFNAPLIGALIGAVIGLTPALHRAFFNDSFDGGIFSAWLTTSLKKLGSVFVPLPVVVAGVSFYTAIKEAWQQRKQQDDSGKAGLPWGTVAFILIVRFILWPVASIAIIYTLASKTDLLGKDPMLWFTLMLMPAGPPATKLVTMVQVSGADPEDEKTIAKIMTISYLVSPILSLAVVGSLKASQAALG